MNLTPVYDRINTRLDDLDHSFSEWIHRTSGITSKDDLMYLEGLTSTLWQYWCSFCRRVVICCSLGCQTRLGTVLSTCVTPTTWERVSYISMRAKSGSSIQPLRENSLLRLEPTWGDVVRIQKTITYLNPQNKNHLLSCFGSVTRGPVHLQRVRNASAHLNSQTLDDVKSLRAYYNSSRIRHPVESLTWIDPSSNDYAFISWITEIRIIAEITTE